MPTISLLVNFLIQFSNCFTGEQQQHQHPQLHLEPTVKKKKLWRWGKGKKNKEKFANLDNPNALRKGEIVLQFVIFIIIEFTYEIITFMMLTSYDKKKIPKCSFFLLLWFNGKKFSL